MSPVERGRERESLLLLHMGNKVRSQLGTESLIQLRVARYVHVLQVQLKSILKNIVRCATNSNLYLHPLVTDSEDIVCAFVRQLKVLENS